MGYVSVSTTEVVGESSSTETIHFELFEDFMAYENRKYSVELDLSATVERSTKDVEKEPEWITWEGGECPVEDGVDCEVMFYDGIIERNCIPQTWSWGKPKQRLNSSHIVAYRVFN